MRLSYKNTETSIRYTQCDSCICPPPHWGRAPSPEIFLIFLSENGEFLCILGGASALYVATAQESEAEEEGRERDLVKDDILH